MKPLKPAAAVALLFAASCSQGLAATNPFDGRWSVTLVCPDTTDRSGPVKGYEYAFAVSIHDGTIEGQYGAPGHPASVVYTGSVSDDGTLEIVATGNTGQSEYAVGKVARGTPYNYTMQGRLEGSGGEASRRERRPCTAKFVKAVKASALVPSPAPRSST